LGEIGRYGSNVEERFEDDQTLLHKAILSGYGIEVVRFLVDDKRADVNAKDKYGSTPLRYARHKGNTPVIEYLFSKE